MDKEKWFAIIGDFYIESPVWLDDQKKKRKPVSRQQWPD